MLKVGDILFSYNKCNPFSYIIWKISSLLSKIKKKGDIHRVSHTAIYIGEGKLIEASYFGVKIDDADKYKASKYVREYGRCTKNFDADKLVADSSLKAGKVDYAYWQVVTILFKRIFNIKRPIDDVQDDAQTCSEFIAYEFKNVGVTLVPQKHPANVTPVDIYNSNHVECRLEA